MSVPTVLGAGGVLWRGGPGDLEVALVHRPKYDDWSLPKGKAKPGEHVLVTALREVKEETGFRAHLGPYLTTVQYGVTSGGSSMNKAVSYWSMRCAEGSFRATSEVDEMQWLSLADAQRCLDAETDCTVLEAFTRTRKDTKLLLLIRHGETVTPPRRSKERPEDQPLNRAGWSRAASLAPVLEVLGVTDLISADQPACCGMLTPLAGATGLSVLLESQLTREGFVGNEKQVADRIQRTASSSDALVVCAGKRVISGLLSALGDRSDVALPDKGKVRRGDLWLLHHSQGAISAYEKHELSA